MTENKEYFPYIPVFPRSPLYTKNTYFMYETTYPLGGRGKYKHRILGLMTENQHQAALFNWAQLNRKKYPALMALFAIPNGLHTSSKIHAARAVTCGLKAGVPDLCLAWAANGRHGMYIELKVPKPQRSTVSPLQVKWLERLTANGYEAKVAYGWEEAKNMIEEYLK